MEQLWLNEARKLIGVHEGIGTLDNPEIVGWAKELGDWYSSFYKNDEIPWCGLFVAICFHRAIPKLVLPKNALAALEWMSWGQPLLKPVLGCVLIFRRTGGGHIGFCLGQDSTTFSVLGGNQGDKVCVEKISKVHLVAMRWPINISLPLISLAQYDTDSATKLS